MARKPLYHPRYWPTWVTLGLLRPLALLPLPAMLALGRVLGSLSYRLLKRRRHITLTNLALCFPEWPQEKREKIARESFRSIGMGAMETIATWWKPRESFRKRVTLIGQEHLDQALENSEGVLLLGAHFSILDLGGALMSLFYKVDGVYRKQNNPVIDAFLLKHRNRSASKAIERRDMRTLVRRLKKNLVWIAADQDAGPNHSVFAPFFGQTAATHISPSRLAQLAKVPVVFIAGYRTDPSGHYELVFHPALEDYPSDDPVQDATRTNRILEEAIRRHPEQYYWIHRRFKTQPNQPKAFLYRR